MTATQDLRFSNPMHGWITFDRQGVNLVIGKDAPEWFKNLVQPEGTNIDQWLLETYEYLCNDLWQTFVADGVLALGHWAKDVAKKAVDHDYQRLLTWLAGNYERSEYVDEAVAIYDWSHTMQILRKAQMLHIKEIAHSLQKECWRTETVKGGIYG